MPGFIIGTANGPTSGPGVLNPVTRDTDWLRTHRFTLLDFFGQLPPRSNKEFLMLKDVTLPDKNVAELAIKTPGTTYKFAKQATYTDLKMTFYGSTALLTKCLQLADKVHDLVTGVQDFNDYKGQISFMINNTGSQSIAGIKYDYSGAWISNVNHGQLTYTSSDIKTITVNVKFDFFEVTSGPVSGGTDVVKNAESASILGAPYNGEVSR